MVGTPLKNLRLFEKICGINAFRNVILTTTMWDEVTQEEGEDRERELITKSWRNMLEHGSTTGRFLGTRESALNLIYPLIGTANKRSSVLLQKELVDMGKKLHSTSAGQALDMEVSLLVRQHEDILRRFRNERKRTDGDKMTLEPLKEEHEMLRNNLEATVKEMQGLKPPLGDRLLNMRDKFFATTRLTVYNLRPSKPDHSPSNIDDKDSRTASMIDSYLSGSQIVDPESEGYLLKAGHRRRSDIELTTFETEISPWMYPSEWLDASTKHIRSIFDGIVDFTEHADIKTVTFPATMIFQVC